MNSRSLLSCRRSLAPSTSGRSRAIADAVAEPRAPNLAREEHLSEHRRLHAEVGYGARGGALGAAEIRRLEPQLALRLHQLAQPALLGVDPVSGPQDLEMDPGVGEQRE